MDQKTITELNKAFTRAPQGFVVIDSGVPHFAVIPYKKFKELEKRKDNPPRAQKVLVTGGAGYIGSHTVQALLGRGHKVVVLDNLSTGRREAVKNCRLIEGDLADEKLLDEIFMEEKPDAIVHFAASIEVEESVKNPGKYYENNITNGIKLLEAMRRHGVNKIIFSSSATVYDEPEKLPITEENKCRPHNPYGETKYIFENILKDYETAHGIHSISLRYFNAAGAWPEEGLGYRRNDNSLLVPKVMNVAAGAAAEIKVFGRDYNTSDGTCVRDYIHVRDLASAHVLALEKLAEKNGVYVYNLGTGKGNSVLEVIESAVEITGHMIPMSVAARRPGDLPVSVADSGKFKREFGWKPKYGIREILESSWEWHRNR